MKSLKHFFAVCFIALLAVGFSSVVPGFDLLVSTAEADPYGRLSAHEILARQQEEERQRCENEGGRYYDGQCEDKEDLSSKGNWFDRNTSLNKGTAHDPNEDSTTQIGRYRMQEEQQPNWCSICGRFWYQNSTRTKSHTCYQYDEDS